MVAELGGEAECLVSTCPGTLRYLDEDLALSCVTAVATSRIARRQGFATRLAARTVAADAAEGAQVCGLGAFDQGFYNRLGFGTGGYEHWVSLDPAWLTVDVAPRVPRRLSAADWEAAHAARLARHRGHGSCNVIPGAFTRAHMAGTENGFGLGYADGSDGELTHYLWCRADAGEHGPYHVEWLVYRTREQFLELMALLKSLGDQVRLVCMNEPPGIQLQDLIDRPFQLRVATEKSRFENAMRADAWWQMRVLDLPGCLARTRLPWADLRFNLRLTDPLETLLDDTEPWRGVAGDYRVTLAASSAAERGADPSLPTLTASVNVFTRLWLGVRPATGLAVTDELSGPPELLQQLDWTLRLPDPKPDWGF
jgi:hypothetical protein